MFIEITVHNWNQLGHLNLTSHSTFTELSDWLSHQFFDTNSVDSHESHDPMLILYSDVIVIGPAWSKKWVDCGHKVSRCECKIINFTLGDTEEHLNGYSCSFSFRYFCLPFCFPFSFSVFPFFFCVFVFLFCE